jgi:hypothetical protein
MQKLKCVLAAAAAVGAITLGSGSASAMPNGLPTSVLSSDVENVRWVCGPYRCWWRPNYYYGGYGFYGPRWRHGWRRW